MSDATIVSGVTSDQVNEAIAQALLHYAEAQAGAHPQQRKMHGVLTKADCVELARVARQAINGTGCVVCQLVDK
jgi:hypothetical protein